MSMKSLLLLFILPGVAFTGCDGSVDKTDSKPGVKDSTEIVSPPVNNFIRLELSQEGIHSAILTSNEKYSYSLVLNGDDPYVFTKPLSASIPSERKILEFEYKTDKEINDLQIFYALGGIPSEALSKKYGSLAASPGYSSFTADVSAFRSKGWGKSGDKLRIDPGDNIGITFGIRNIKIRPMTEAEKKAAEDAAAAVAAKENMARNLGAYLDKTYPSSVNRVEVTADKVIIEGSCGSSGSYFLADICPWQDVTEMTEFPYAEKIGNGDFSITVDRIVKDREGISYDRVFSKWAVVMSDGGRQILDSHARYADEVASIENPQALPLKNKKGLGAGDIDLYFQDCDEMNIGSITMNVLLNGIVSGTGSGYYYGGVGYSTGGVVSYCDRIVSRARALGISVAAIILVPSNSAYKDPENEGGYYSMPDITTAKAFNMYAAALTYMASRYCKNNPGRIHNWIMHNEVDAGTEWTNMGEQPMMRFLDRYVKSMRICYGIVRQYDQNASVMASFTHSWTAAASGYSPKEILERTVAYSKAEGDFKWGVAYHPYPQDLTKPEFWKNDAQSTYSMDSKYVTFRNLEVIDKWIKLPENLYQGTTKRLLYLSEQGTNSPSYGDSDLSLQAAGGAWAWKKVSRLDGIDAIQWHNWADNKAEFGLRIGLRTFDELPYQNLSPKPVWYVWKAGGTAEEDSVFNPYMSTLGITSWDQIMHEVK